MSNYVQSTNFATKDALVSGNALKIVKGTEINTEYANIAIAVATKADLVSPTFTGTLTAVNEVLTGTLSVAGTTTLSSALNYGGITLSNSVTGTGSMVLSTSPTLTTPNIGTPSAGVLTSCTGLPMTTGVTGTLAVANGGTGVTSSTGTGNTVLSASPTFTGTPLAPTASTSTNTTQLATTAFVQAVMQTLHPVGSIYINATNATNPGTLLGFGTWTAFGAGRVPVGFDSTNVLFDTAEETGGSATATLPSHTHTFTGTALPTHTHNINSSFTTLSSVSVGTTTPIGGVETTTTEPASGGTPAGTNSTEGASATNANYQPYITVYMWKRTA